MYSIFYDEVPLIIKKLSLTVGNQKYFACEQLL